jgi:hypothetical protein
MWIDIFLWSLFIACWIGNVRFIWHVVANKRSPGDIVDDIEEWLGVPTQTAVRIAGLVTAHVVIVFGVTLVLILHRLGQ